MCYLYHAGGREAIGYVSLITRLEHVVDRHDDVRRGFIWGFLLG